ncbi:hypothetical protein LB505_001655 [Fusarium chuoi]|nr:hypothetical protein LB505_001655 [Fusarium chuoi]
MYRQQTGFVPGAIANTMAVNQTNNTGYQDFRNIDYLTTFSPEADLFDFNTSPSQATLVLSKRTLAFPHHPFCPHRTTAVSGLVLTPKPLSPRLSNNSDSSSRSFSSNNRLSARHRSPSLVARPLSLPTPLLSRRLLSS